MRRWFFVILGGLAVLAIGCTTARTPVVLAPVGPARPEQQAGVATGYLQVYSAAWPYFDGVYYYPHTDYRIYSEDGTLLERVRNATAWMDENPALVRLAVGRYVVEAESESYGWVRVPVVIENGRTTPVRLERGWYASVGAAGTDGEYVRLPNGLIVGTRAGTN